MQELSLQRLLQPAVLAGLVLAGHLPEVDLNAQERPAGDTERGKAFFQASCAVCHSPVLGPDNLVLMKQGPSLVGVVGRGAGSLPHFNYTKAIRQSGLTWDPATLYRFLENPMVVLVKERGYYGWPWFYLGSYEDPSHAGTRPDLAGKAIVPDVLIQSHSACLQMTFYTATSGAAVFPADYRGDAFVALHGSWNRTIRTGYKVVRVLLNHGVPTGQDDDFLTGFVIDNRSVWGRPVGVTVTHDGALLVTEDGNGTIWRIAYEGAKYSKNGSPLRASSDLVVTR